MKPMMSDREIEIVESLLSTAQPRRVLEWGAGNSTLYWPGRFPGILKWVAIEHTKEWYERIVGGVHPKVNLLLRSREDYYWPLLECSLDWDFILVDGLYRRECMVVASRILALRGIVVLHDAGREEYRPSWRVFPHHEVLYPGELPTQDGRGYLHRGIAVFWRDENVRREDWCRDHQLR